MNRGVCLYPGSFDPVTCGHMDIIRRASQVFDRVIVGVLHNPDKAGFFPVDMRVEILKKACAGLDRVQVIAYGGSERVRNMTLSREYDVMQGTQVFTIQLPSGRKLYYINPTLT